MERRIYSDNRPGTFTIMSANSKENDTLCIYYFPYCLLIFLGKIVSKKKEDLQRALDHFGLMVRHYTPLLYIISLFFL